MSNSLSKLFRNFIAETKGFFCIIQWQFTLEKLFQNFRAFTFLKNYFFIYETLYIEEKKRRYQIKSNFEQNVHNDLIFLMGNKKIIKSKKYILEIEYNIKLDVEKEGELHSG